MTTRTADTSLPDLGHLPGTPHYRRIVGALFAAGVATFTLLYSTQALFPEFVRDFGVSSGQSTLSLSLTTLGIGVMLLVAGPLSDVIGRTRMIHLSLAGAAVVAVLCAFAPSWPALLVLRFVEGVVLAGLPAVATAYLREELHPSTHAKVAGLYIGGTAIGGMIGRLLTGMIGEAAGWRWALGAAALVGVACAVVVRLALPDSRHFVARAPGARSLVRMFVRALRDPALLALYGVGFLSVGSMVAVYNTLGFRLAEAPWHLGLGAASLVFLVYPVGTVSSTLFGGLADRYGRRTILPLGCVLAVAGLLVTMVDSLPVIAIGMALFTGGFFAVHGIASGWVPTRAHAGGVASGQAASLYLVGFYLGSSLFGTVAGPAWSAAGWAGVVGLSLALLVLTAALSGFLRRTPALVTA
ncbi:putative transporter [Marmoricola endophyticus]|uniref:Transporter n=1 Tax=Marmoricola endophyticus TaxID=2040280 RepID=A0A917BL92_9ACTN|nr:MFS transporter [Marmoricola endophyticus]GGF50520.1 putative transporter [Marmoricola endophyticus]